MRRLAAVLSLVALSACATGGTQPAAWTPSQTAYIELAIATAAVDVAKSASIALPPADQVAVAAGILVFEHAVQTQIVTLTAGGSISAQAQSAAVGAIDGAVSDLGAILAAKPAAAVNPTAVGMAAGTSALQALPAVAGAIIAVNGGLQPDAPTLAASLATFVAAAQ